MIAPLPVEVGLDRDGRHQKPFIGFGPTALIALTNSSSIGREPIPLGDRHLQHLDPLGLQREPLERLLDVAHARAEELAAADEVALVVLARLAAEERHPVEAARHRVGDQDGVDGAETAHRNDADGGGKVQAVDPRHVERGVRVVLARQRQDARLVRSSSGISTARIIDDSMSTE